MTSANPEILVQSTQCRLEFARAIVPRETPRLRGFFGKEFAEQVLMHHHLLDGGLLYDYPRIQFKVIDKFSVLLGLAEGGELLEQVWMTVDTARIGHENLPVLESRITRHTEPIGESVSQIRYFFITPWLPLNQNNYARFMKLKSWRERSELLERILVGNLLSFSKAFQYSVKRQLVADCSALLQVKTTLKGLKLIGFTGQFSVNFLLPHLAGLGKSVSRGFGTVSAAENQNNVFIPNSGLIQLIVVISNSYIIFFCDYMQKGLFIF